MTYQDILYDVSDRIATVTLNRPDRMNAWTPGMERDVRHAMETAAKDDGVRVIVLTGAGRAFCAGADMDALKGLDPNDIRRRGEDMPAFDMNRRPDWQARYSFYPSISKPVIAMLNGAFGSPYDIPESLQGKRTVLPQRLGGSQRQRGRSTRAIII